MRPPQPISPKQTVSFGPGLAGASAAKREAPAQPDAAAAAATPPINLRLVVVELTKMLRTILSSWCGGS